MGKVTVHDILKNGYDYTKNKQKGRLRGYILDEALSNHNHQTYYHPIKKKLLFNVNGTHNANDWITNAKLAIGKGYKESKRYQESHSALREAKAKYNTDRATVTGHSQGGATAGYISSKQDRVITLDKAATIGQKVRSNEKAYRTAGDVVSILNTNSKHMITLKNPNMRFRNGAVDAYLAHNISNIKNNDELETV